MCALNSCAATGARMKPMTRLVTTASGTRISTASAVLNRISEKTGASAAPKNAVLMWAENASPLKRAYRKTPRTIDQMLSRFLPNRPNPSTRNRQATAAPVTLARGDAVDQAGGQGEQAGVRAGRADAADAEIVGQQRVARQDDVDEAAQDPIGTVDDEPEHDEGGRVRGHEAQDDAVGQRLDVDCRSRHPRPSCRLSRSGIAQHADRRAAASGARILVHRRGLRPAVPRRPRARAASGSRRTRWRPSAAGSRC